MGGASGRITKTRNTTKPRVLAPTMQATNISRRGSSGHRVRETCDAVNALFDQFKDPDEDKIGPESLEQLMSAIELDPLDITALIFAWKLNAQTPCEFTRSEFVNGLIALGIDSLTKLKRKVPALVELIADPLDFRSFYIYAFDYNKPPGQRSMPIDTARKLWPLVLAGRFAHMDLWLEFLDGRTHAITRDSYVLVLDFATTVLPDMSNFDEEGGAWPVLLDEFVEYARPKLGLTEHRRNDDMMS